MMSTANDRFRRPAVFVLVGILCLSMVAGVVSAQEQRTGGSVTVGPEETHEGDLEVTAGDVRIEGTVDGDLTATGGTVTVTGDVTGDVTATAGSVILEGTVEGGLTATGGDVHLREPSTVAGMVRATGGTVTLDGAIDGDARLDGDTVRIGPTATIGGDLTYSADEASISEDAEIAGEVTETDRDELGMGPFSDVSLPDIPGAAVTPLAGVYLFCANFVLGAVLLLAAPRFSDRVSDHGTDRPLLSGGVGLLTLLATPFAIGALFLSIVGIPLAFFATYGFIFVLWVGLVYGAFVIGTWVLSAFGRDHRWGGLALGLGIVSLVNALPYVELLLVVIALVGIGAFVRALYTGRFDGGNDETSGRRPYPAVEASAE